jgi:hypothetical protein
VLEPGRQDGARHPRMHHSGRFYLRPMKSCRLKSERQVKLKSRCQHCPRRARIANFSSARHVSSRRQQCISIFSRSSRATRPSSSLFCSARCSSCVLTRSCISCFSSSFLLLPACLDSSSACSHAFERAWIAINTLILSIF